MAWKIILIIALVCIAAVMIYPVDQKLRQGLDLAGGTSLIYGIDTEGLDATEIKGLAAKMIPNLQKRVDPTKVANITIRPQGDTRIEILLPVSSKDTKMKRKTYEDALAVIEAQNVNLGRISRALSAKTSERDNIFAEFAGDSESRKTMLSELADAYDALAAKEKQRDGLAKQLDELKTKLDKAKLPSSYIDVKVKTWSEMDEKARDEAITKYVEDTLKDAKKDDGIVENIADAIIGTGPAKKLINQYIDASVELAAAMDELSAPQTGVRAMYEAAKDKLRGINLSIEQLTDTLELSAQNADRSDKLEAMMTSFPERKDDIQSVIDAHAEYSKVSGRLDDPEDLKRMLKGSGVLEFRILPSANDTQLMSYVDKLKTEGPKQASDSRYKWVEIESPENWGMRSAIMGQFGDKVYVLASNQSGETMLKNPEKPWRLKKAYTTTDRNGRPVIGFTHDEVAKGLFHKLTSKNVGRPLCILLDNKALSAPNISEAIGKRGTISGSFTQTEREDMINKLNAGSFYASLSEVPIMEKSIGALIGAENRNQGIQAGLFGLLAVAVFMIFYYKLSGVVAVFALLMNLLFVIAMMVMLRATFTLPGIAGLILTIGMSVDANVLIFERIREEQGKGTALRGAIANGYQRAFRTIFDANVTTFGVAAILYTVASEEIKGFAIVLMLGIVSCMFTALFVTRVIFDVLLDGKVIRDHLNMRCIVKSANIDWMKLRNGFFVVSGLLIITGLLVFFGRDEAENSKFDIEFTGGTSIQVDFLESAGWDTQKVKGQIEEIGNKYNNPALVASKVYTVGSTGKQFEITTTATNKTEATVTFAQADQSIESVKKDIEAALDKLAATMYNLDINTEDGKTFTVSTSQVNKAVVRNTLNKAFKDKATVSEPQVNEIVTEAVKEAFAGMLKVREDLGVTITKTSKVPAESVELEDFIGGAMISCKLDNAESIEEVQKRFKDIRFKLDTRDLSWYQYKIVSDDLAEFAPGADVKSFVYVSILPDAGFRKIEAEQWDRYILNETTKIKSAASLETTLARVTQIDPSVGRQAQQQAIVAIVLALAAIVAYIWIRFGTARYGFAAIAALVHDVCITLGLVTSCTFVAGILLIGDFKIDLAMIAAFLTIVGYSLNDTIVVFDRIRENRGKARDITEKMITASINQTLSRTLLTSLTTFLVVLVMYIWGGPGLRGFTFAMLVGIVIGTYSSIAIAAPILILAKKKALADN